MENSETRYHFMSTRKNLNPCNQMCFPGLSWRVKIAFADGTLPQSALGRLQRCRFTL